MTLYNKMYGITVVLNLYKEQLKKAQEMDEKNNKLRAESSTSDIFNAAGGGAIASFIMLVFVLYFALFIYSFMVIFSDCFPDGISKIIALLAMFFIPGANLVIPIAGYFMDCRMGHGKPILSLSGVSPIKTYYF